MVREAEMEVKLLKEAMMALTEGLVRRSENGANVVGLADIVRAFEYEGRFWAGAEEASLGVVAEIGWNGQSPKKKIDYLESWAETMRALKRRVYEEIAEALEPTPSTLRAVQKGYGALNGESTPGAVRSRGGGMAEGFYRSL
jgi:hypothetical protein